MRFENDQFHVRSPEEMYAALPGHEEALAQSSLRSPRWSRTTTRASTSASASSPRSSPAREKTPEAYLRELCERGLHERYDGNPSGRVAMDRLDHELGIIDRMGFASYFLIVWDFVRYRPRAGHTQLGEGIGLRGDRELPPPPEPRLTR